MNATYSRHCLDGEWHDITKLNPDNRHSIDELAYLLNVLDVPFLADDFPHRIILNGFYDSLSLRRMLEAGERPSPRDLGVLILERSGRLTVDISVSEEYL